MPTEQRAQILAEALTWCGTPYHHQACVKGVGVDCVMLIAGICKAVGLLPPVWEPPVYSPEWHLHNNEERLMGVLDALGCQAITPIASAQPGDLLLFQYGRVASHVGLLMPDGYVLHAVLRDRVRLYRIDAALRKRQRGAYALPGVTP